MAVTAPLLLYVAYHLPALGLAGWAAASALAPDPGIGRGQRAWTLLAALSLPALVVVLALSALLHRPEWRALGVLLPILTIAGAASNVVTVRRQGPGARLIHLPILAWNATLAGIGAVRCFQDLTGIDTGTAGTALVAGHGLLQLTVGSELAATRPVWMHLPLLLPLDSRYHGLHWLTLGTTSLLGAVMFALLGSGMPAAWDRAAGYRGWERTAVEVAAERRDIALALSAPVAERPGSSAAREAWRAGLLGVDGAALVVHVDATTLSDPDIRAAIRGEADFARAAARAVIAVVDLPADAPSPIDTSAFQTALGRGAWLAAEHLEPDWIVLPAAPRAALATSDASLLDEALAAAELAPALTRLANETRGPAPDVRLAVAIRDVSPRGADLLRALGADAGFDAVVLTVEVEREAPADFAERLATWGTWLNGRRSDDGAAIWFAVAAAPHLVGGETGQWHAIRAVLDLARSTPSVERVVIEQLVDADAERGIMTADGRTRLAWRSLRRATPAATPR